MIYGYIVVAEKPSVARAIDRVLKSNHINAIVDSTRGHILDSELPNGFEWGRVNPREIFNVLKPRLIIRDSKVYKRIKSLFMKYPLYKLVIATDNDSEGELIGYEILLIYREVRGNDLFWRMRFNSVDYRELWRAWNNLEPDLNWRWVYKALFRQNFDLITGAAFTRFLTELARRRSRVRLISWGSCQTPTLYFVVSREREIINFKPSRYWYIEAVLRIGSRDLIVRSEKYDSLRRVREDFKKVYGARFAEIADYNEEVKVVRRPTPVMTDDLLKDISQIAGISAAETLSIAEDLYSDGYISYPRTETNKYPEGFDFKTPLNAVLKSAIANEIISYISSTPNPLNGRHDDKAHPPIYHIKPHPRDGSKRWIIWEYIARRFIANVYSKDARIARQKVRVFIGGIELTASGSLIVDEGFYKIFPYFKPSINPLPRVRRGAIVYVKNVVVREGKTQPPKRLSEADLLSLMIKHNIGTDATRARYPKLIIDRNYAVKRRGRFRPTGLGMKLIEALESVDKRLVTPDTRRYVEELMERIGKGEIEMDEALEKAIEEYKKLYLECEKNADIIEEILSESLRELNEKH